MYEQAFIVRRRAPLKFAWTGVLSVRVEKAWIADATAFEKGRRRELVDVGCILSVPTNFGHDDDAPHMEPAELISLEQVDFNKALAWDEQHAFKINFLMPLAENLQIVVELRFWSQRRKITLTACACLPLKSALDESVPNHQLEFVADDGFSGTISLSCSWDGPFLENIANNAAAAALLNRRPSAVVPRSMTTNIVSNSDRTAVEHQYAQAYDAWQDMRDHEIDAHLTTTTDTFCAKTLYNFWSPSEITRKLVRREHIVPKLFGRVPPLTRVERWAVLSSAIQTGMFFLTFLFRADCVMVPKPPECMNRSSFLENTFMPSWETAIGALEEVILTVPVPLILTSLFRKVPVQEKLTPQEKRAKIYIWGVLQTIGWCLVLSIHGFVAFFLVRFACAYESAVFESLTNAAWQSVFHRFITAPVGRALIFAFLVVCSKYMSCFDLILVLYPWIIPVGTLRKVAKAKKQKDLFLEEGADDGNNGLKASPNAD